MFVHIYWKQESCTCNSCEAAHVYIYLVNLVYSAVEETEMYHHFLLSNVCKLI